LPNDGCCQLFGSPRRYLACVSRLPGKRGTDQSFDRRSQIFHDGPQFIAELEKLVDAVCTRIGQNKVAIMNKEARVVAARAQRAARSCHAA